MATGLPKTKWNGRKKGGAADPTPVDFQISYEGKASTEEVLATPPAQPKRVWSPSESTRNALYFGDNLTVLAHLLDTLRSSVQLVYIDPPFATRMVYQSRAADAAYTDLLTGAHYLEFLRRRVILLRELLADNGSLYLHLDDNMVSPTKLILDEVFGPKNFRNLIVRKKCNPKNYTRKAFGNVCDYILFYTKSDEYIWNRQFDPWSPGRDKEYQYVEPSTGRRFMKVPVHAPGTRNGATGGLWRGVPPPPGKHWQFPPAALDEMDARGEIYWSPNGNPRRKVYLDQSLGVPVQDLWLDYRDAHNQNIDITGYPTEKTPALLQRIIEASSRKGDLILDCFAGSGTTLAVASQLERSWIGVDNSPHAMATILKRFTHGTKRMGDFVQRPPEPDLADALTLSLFPNARPTPSPAPKAARKITDFTLYAATEPDEEISTAIAAWEEAVTPPTAAPRRRSGRVVAPAASSPAAVNSKQRTRRVRQNLRHRQPTRSHR